MNIFQTLKTYAGNWNVTNERNFTREEIECVEKAEVVDSTYGLSVCFMMKSGGKTFIPVSTDSSISVGESVDLTQAKVLTLSKQGENDITRIMI